MGFLGLCRVSLYIIDRWQMQQEDYNLKSISFDLGGSRHQTV